MGEPGRGGAYPGSEGRKIVRIVPFVYPSWISKAGGRDGADESRQIKQTQTVRLAEDVAFPDSVTEVTIIRDGPRRIIVPAGGQWDDFFDASGIPIQEPKTR